MTVCVHIGEKQFTHQDKHFINIPHLCLTAFDCFSATKNACICKLNQSFVTGFWKSIHKYLNHKFQKKILFMQNIIKQFLNFVLLAICADHSSYHNLHLYLNELFIVRSLRSRMLCEAYEVGWDFVIALEQQYQQSQPHKNLAALHTGKGPSCYQ